MKRYATSLVFRSGRLTALDSICLVLLGFGVVVLSLLYLPSKPLKLIGISLGLAVAAVGGFSGRAVALDLPPPFTNDPIGWRAAKKSYDQIHAQDAPKD